MNALSDFATAANDMQQLAEQWQHDSRKLKIEQDRLRDDLTQFLTTCKSECLETPLLSKDGKPLFLRFTNVAERLALTDERIEKALFAVQVGDLAAQAKRLAEKAEKAEKIAGKKRKTPAIEDGEASEASKASKAIKAKEDVATSAPPPPTPLWLHTLQEAIRDRLREVHVIQKKRIALTCAKIRGFKKPATPAPFSDAVVSKLQALHAVGQTMRQMVVDHKRASDVVADARKEAEPAVKAFLALQDTKEKSAKVVVNDLEFRVKMVPRDRAKPLCMTDIMQMVSDALVKRMAPFLASASSSSSASLSSSRSAPQLDWSVVWTDALRAQVRADVLAACAEWRQSNRVKDDALIMKLSKESAGGAAAAAGNSGGGGEDDDDGGFADGFAGGDETGFADGCDDEEE